MGCVWGECIFILLTANRNKVFPVVINRQENSVILEVPRTWSTIKIPHYNNCRHLGISSTLRTASKLQLLSGQLLDLTIYYKGVHMVLYHKFECFFKCICIAAFHCNCFKSYVYMFYIFKSIILGRVP